MRFRPSIRLVQRLCFNLLAVGLVTGIFVAQAAIISDPGHDGKVLAEAGESETASSLARR